MTSLLLLDQTTGQSYPLEPLPFTIGRGSYAHLQLNDPGISRSHCVITQNQGLVCVTNQSPGGTLVNDSPIADQTSLTLGDTLTIGNRTFTLVNSGDGSETMVTQSDALAAPEIESLVAHNPTEATAVLATPAELERNLTLHGPGGICFHLNASANNSQYHLGRSGDNDFILNGQSVSAQHALFEFTGKHWWVKDLGSTNGLKINNRRCGRKQRKILPGDSLMVGEEALKVRTFDGQDKLEKNAWWLAQFALFILINALILAWVLRKII